MAFTPTGYSTPFTENIKMMSQREFVRKEWRILKKHEQTTNVRFNIKPPLHDATRDQLAMARSVYGARLRPIPEQQRLFDRIIKPGPDWDPKVKHDAYRNLLPYKINAREDDRNREIPILANGEPGHRLHSRPERFNREHARVCAYHNNIFRNNGITFHESQ